MDRKQRSTCTNVIKMIQKVNLERFPRLKKINFRNKEKEGQIYNVIKTWYYEGVVK